MEQPLGTSAGAPQSGALETIEGCDGRTSWSKFGNAPAQITPGFCGDVADIDGLLVTFKEKGLSFEFVGDEKVEGQDVYHLKLTKEDRFSALLSGCPHFPGEQSYL